MAALLVTHSSVEALTNRYQNRIRSSSLINIISNSPDLKCANLCSASPHYVGGLKTYLCDFESFARIFRLQTMNFPHQRLWLPWKICTINRSTYKKPLLRWQKKMECSKKDVHLYEMAPMRFYLFNEFFYFWKIDWKFSMD